MRYPDENIFKQKVKNLSADTFICLMSNKNTELK